MEIDYEMNAAIERAKECALGEAAGSAPYPPKPLTRGIEIGRDMRIEIEHGMVRIVTGLPNTVPPMPRYYASGGTLTEAISDLVLKVSSEAVQLEAIAQNVQAEARESASVASSGLMGGRTTPTGEQDAK